MTKKEVSQALVNNMKAVIPPPKANRRHNRVLISLSDIELLRVESFAAKRDEKLATAVRTLALGALDALGE